MFRDVTEKKNERKRKESENSTKKWGEKDNGKSGRHHNTSTQNEGYFGIEIKKCDEMDKKEKKTNLRYRAKKKNRTHTHTFTRMLYFFFSTYTLLYNHYSNTT